MNKDLIWESDWWGNCCNTYGEETKQLQYAKAMGLKFHHNGKSPYFIDMVGKSVLDIGGGPVSLLLKCENVQGVVIDPCEYPQWVYDRYDSKFIDVIKIKAENLNEVDLSICVKDGIFDECWIYNVLTHTLEYEKIINNALKICKILRFFEWINQPISEGHPVTLTRDILNKCLGGIGKTEFLHESGCYGEAYYGIFKGKLF